MSNRKQMQPQPKSMRIDLEQHEQDFNYFELEYDGMRRGVHDVHVPVYKIVETGPFQGWLWNGKLIDGTTINKEYRPAILFDDEWKVLNYPITKISKVLNP